MIRCQNLSKSFRRARALDGIDLDIALGERIALIGSNGAGKTTLIRCLLGKHVHDATTIISSHRIDEVAGFDRPRFIGVLSRYVALIDELSLRKEKD